MSGERAVVAEEPKYWAFISYSHCDKAVGDWLHRALERYRVPRRLVGRATRNGPVPRRLFPIFKDTEELPTDSDLGRSLRDALRSARFLVVVCSPHSAASRWVNEEVLEFKRLGRADRILCVIAAGEPNASDRPGGGALECFCPALRRALDANGEATGERVEPIAADLRPGAGGRALAHLRIAAGLLGVGFDELRQRDRAARRRRYAMAAGLAALAGLGGGGTFFQFEREARIAGERARVAEAERVRAEAAAAEARRREAEEQKGRIRQQALAQINSARLLFGDGKLDEAITAMLAGEEATSQPEGRALLRQMYEHSRLSKVLGRHRDQILSLALGVSGATIAVGTTGNEALLWDTAAGRVIARFRFPLPPRVIAHPSEPGLLLVVGGSEARLVDAATGTLRRTLNGHEGLIGDAAFYPGWPVVVTVSNTGEVFAWNTEDGRLLHRFESHAGNVTAVSFNRRGQMLTLTRTVPQTAGVARWGDSVVRVFDFASKRELFALKPPEQIPDAAAAGESHFFAARLSSGAERLATVTNRGGRFYLHLWDSRTGALIAHLERDAGQTAFPFTFDRDGELFAAEDGNDVRIWDARTGKPVNRLIGHSRGISSIAFDQRGRRIATAASDGTVRLWYPRGGRREIAIFRGHRQQTIYAAFDDAAERLITASTDGTIRLWSLAGRDRGNLLDGVPELRGLAVAVSVRDADGVLAVRAAVSSYDGTLSVADLTAAKRLGALPGPKAQVFSAAFSPDGKMLLAALHEGGARLWDVEGLSEIALLRLADDPTPSFKHVALAPDARTAFTVRFDGTLTAWDVDRRKARWSVPLETSDAASLRLDPAGTLIAAVAPGRGQTVRVFKVATGEEVAALVHETRPPSFAAFHPDGRRLLTGSADGLIRLWDVGSKSLLATWRGHQQHVDGAVFDKGGRLAATSGRDGLIIVWDVETGTPLLAERSNATVVALGADGSTLISSYTGDVRRWDVRTISEADALAWARDIARALETRVGE